jgi:hypothetical protein
MAFPDPLLERDEAIADGIDRILEASESKDDQDTNVIRFRRAAEQVGGAACGCSRWVSRGGQEL